MHFCFLVSLLTKIESDRLLKMYIFSGYLYAGTQMLLIYHENSPSPNDEKNDIQKFQAPFNLFYTKAEIDNDNLVVTCLLQC